MPGPDRCPQTCRAHPCFLFWGVAARLYWLPSKPAFLLTCPPPPHPTPSPPRWTRPFVHAPAPLRPRVVSPLHQHPFQAMACPRPRPPCVPAPKYGCWHTMHIPFCACPRMRAVPRVFMCARSHAGVDPVLTLPLLLLILGALRAEWTPLRADPPCHPLGGPAPTTRRWTQRHTLIRSTGGCPPPRVPHPGPHPTQINTQLLP